jgi:hypothetical protein
MSRDPHHGDLWNPLKFPVKGYKVTKPVPAGYELVGVSCTKDKDGMIVWINFIIWKKENI